MAGLKDGVGMGLPATRIATSARLQERSRQTLNVSRGFVKIDGLLCVHPEVRRSAEGRAEPQRHLGRYGAPAVDDAVHDLDIALQVVGQNPLAQPERDEKLFTENLSGGCRLAAAQAVTHLHTSVVIPDVDVNRTGDPPLVVDPDAMEAK